MSMRFRTRMAAMRGDAPPPPNDDSDSSSNENTENDKADQSEKKGPSENSAFSPTTDDVDQLRQSFKNGLKVSHTSVPVEVTDMILNEAEYWPVIRRSTEKEVKIRAWVQDRPSSAAVLVVSDPIPKPEEGEAVKVQKVVFRMTGRDQGWVSNNQGSVKGTYKGSWSYYQASIYRPVIPEATLSEKDFSETKFCYPSDADQVAQSKSFERLPRIWGVQDNKVAHKEYISHEVTWYRGSSDTDDEDRDLNVDGSRKGDGFIDALQPGDRVALWARAEFPGWQNFTQKAEVEIYYST